EDGTVWIKRREVTGYYKERVEKMMDSSVRKQEATEHKLTKELKFYPADADLPLGVFREGDKQEKQTQPARTATPRRGRKPKTETANKAKKTEAVPAAPEPTTVEAKTDDNSLSQE